MTLSLATGSLKAPLKVRKDDLYETPEVATRALLKCEDLPHRIWEPACGRGAIVRVLAAAGHDVHATDLVDYGFPGALAGRDFLLELAAPGFECVVTNPPFKLAGEFVEHALRLCPRVVMLARLALLESTRRNEILDRGHLARVHVFRRRLPFMHRDGYEGPKNSSSGMAFAWFVWDRDHKGPTELRRISWEAA